MPIDVRPLRDEEVAGWVDTMSLGFLRPPAGREEAEFRRGQMDLTRTLASVDGGTVVGTLRSFPTELTVPGGARVPVSALTNVTVRPTHRRRGLLDQMLGMDLRASAERGEVASILIASEYRIYGRYGYGPAADHVTVEVDAGTRFAAPPGGTVEIVDVSVARRLLPEVYERHRLTQPGAIARWPERWDVELGIRVAPSWPAWKGRVAIHRDEDGHADGYVTYHVDDKWENRLPRSTLVVDALVSATPWAYADLWRFCCEVDLIATVRASDRSVDEPLRWLVDDARTVRQVERSDFLWVRLLDTPAALTARHYAIDGRLVLDVVDPDDPGARAAGRFALEIGPDGTTCEPTGDDPDLELPVDVLGALWLGGVSVRSLADAGRLAELQPGAVDAADALFRWPVAPWCNTWF